MSYCRKLSLKFFQPTIRSCRINVPLIFFKYSLLKYFINKETCRFIFSKSLSNTSCNNSGRRNCILPKTGIDDNKFLSYFSHKNGDRTIKFKEETEIFLFLKDSKYPLAFLKHNLNQLW